MNVDRMLELLELLEDHTDEQSVNLNQWWSGEECGCIAGHVTMRLAPEDWRDDMIEAAAMDWLDITQSEADVLFAETKLGQRQHKSLAIQRVRKVLEDAR